MKLSMSLNDKNDVDAFSYGVLTEAQIALRGKSSTNSRGIHPPEC